MGKRSYSGGTTALVIVLTLVIIIVGVAFFFWMKIIGGGNELQHATDSGNLNVAKQSLRSPSVALQAAGVANVNELNEFGDLTDPNSSPANQVDLLVYDRLVGKAVIVALNASQEGTQAAKKNANDLDKAVEGPGGIGSRLASQLNQNSNLSGFFTNLSQANSTRMLQNDGTITPSNNNTPVAFMARTKATNIFIAGNQIPGASTFLSNTNNVITKMVGGVNKTYITGYDKLQCGVPGVQPMAVPMRPGEQPHLVDVNDFAGLVAPPLGNAGNAQIPPNAFRSDGTGVEGNRTGNSMTMRSCAVIGTLNLDFPISLPRGYIIVDNTGASNLYGSGPNLGFNAPITGGGINADMVLMSPSYVGLVPESGGDVFGLPGQVEQLISDCNAPKPDSTAIQNDMNTITSTGGSMGGITTPSQAIATFAASPPVTPIQCINTNTEPGATAPNASCVKDYQTFMNHYNQKVPEGGAVAASGLMAIEKFKCDVLAARAAVGDGGCGATSDGGVCTGLKYYDAGLLTGSATLGSGGLPPCLPCNFGNPNPTLSQLLSITNGGALADQSSNPLGDLITRLYQIQPNPASGEISNVVNGQVPFGQISYIYLNKSNTLTLSTNPPQFPIVASAGPDGQPSSVTGTAPFVPPTMSGNPPSLTNPSCPSPMTCYALQGNLNGTVLNLDNCEGYPHPWDCPDLPAQGLNSAQWTPSSGFNNLLGVLRFFNCAEGGGSNWCCPC